MLSGIESNCQLDGGNQLGGVSLEVDNSPNPEIKETESLRAHLQRDEQNKITDPDTGTYQKEGGNTTTELNHENTS